MQGFLGFRGFMFRVSWEVRLGDWDLEVHNGTFDTYSVLYVGATMGTVDPLEFGVCGLGFGVYGLRGSGLGLSCCFFFFFGVCV